MYTSYDSELNPVRVRSECRAIRFSLLASCSEWYSRLVPAVLFGVFTLMTGLVFMTDASEAKIAADDSTLVPNEFDLQGHRGARGLAPENTIPAFRRALEIGVTTLEMDVVLSKDGEVVVSHEPWMNPQFCSLPSGDPVPEEEAHQHNLYHMSYTEIERYDCGQRRHPDFPRQERQPAAKPLLRGVIAMAEAYVSDHNRPPAFYNIEIKSRPAWDGTFHPKPSAFSRHVLAEIHENGVAARTTIQSFDRRILRESRQYEFDGEWSSRVRYALLVGRMKPGGFSRHTKQLGFRPDVYSPDYRRVNERLVQRAQKDSVRVVPWTVNDRTAMRRIVQMGADGFITDYPDVGREILDDITSE